MKKFKKIRDLVNLITQLSVDELAYKITLQTETKKLIIDLNTQEQLFEGINSEGQDLESIGGEYRPYTIEIKRQQGLPTDRVTLFQSGSFYDSFEIDVFKGGFNIVADTDKEDGDLQFRWGSEILGLTEDSKKDLVNYYRNEILREIKKRISKV